MSITIRDCLNLPSFSFGNVVAGKNGLDKIVSSVSVMEFFSLSDFDVFTPVSYTHLPVLLPSSFHLEYSWKSTD